MADQKQSVSTLLKRAKARAKMGEMYSARTLCTQVLGKFPKNKQANDLVAQISKTPADQSQPNPAAIRNFESQRNSGNIQSALEIAEAYKRTAPHSYVPHFMAAVALADGGTYGKAIESFQNALAWNPNHFDSLINLGALQNEMSDPKAAIQSLSRAAVLQSHQPDVQTALGEAYSADGETALALACFDQALALIPGDLASTYGKAMALFVGRDFSAAEALLKELLAANDEDYNALNSLGSVYVAQGKSKDAIDAYERSIAIHPYQGEAHSNLARTKTYTSDDPHLTQMTELLARDDVPSKDKAYLNFALGTAYDKLEQPTQAFKCFAAGNAIRKSVFPYDLAKDAKLFASLKKSFPGPQSKPVVEPSTPKPIFILGMPRSGTSLIEQVISAHSKVFGADELVYFEEAVQMHGDDFAAISQAYQERVRKLSFEQTIFTDKMPLNFQWIGHILNALPDAKIIHLKRDPRAVCWSNFKTLYSSEGNSFAYDQNDLAGYYHLYEDLVAHWAAVFPNQIYTLNYETFTQEQEPQTRALLVFCDLEWEEACLHFHKNNRAVLTASVEQVRKGLYQGSSEAWKQYEPHLHPLLNALQTNGVA